MFERELGGLRYRKQKEVFRRGKKKIKKNSAFFLESFQVIILDFFGSLVGRGSDKVALDIAIWDMRYEI